MKEFTLNGKILEGVGGNYTVRINAPETKFHKETVFCPARGAFRHEGISPLPGDDVVVTVSLRDEDCPLPVNDPKQTKDGSSAVIAEILPRKNALIRPPMANLELLFAVFASADPEPMPDVIDKLLLIAEQNEITPVVVITKSELNPAKAKELEEIYSHTPYPVFTLSAVTGEGVAEFSDFVKENLPGKIAAFAGASGIGKSTLMNTLFPHLALPPSAVSQKIGRGRHTTRKVSLFPIAQISDLAVENTFLADTPGFSMLDFVHFDFFDLEDLPFNFPEFREHLGTCRYTKCTHLKEDGCSILAAVNRGEIAPSRHQSYVTLYDILKKKHKWDKPDPYRKGF